MPLESTLLVSTHTPPEVAILQHEKKNVTKYCVEVGGEGILCHFSGIIPLLRNSQRDRNFVEPANIWSSKCGREERDGTQGGEMGDNGRGGGGVQRSYYLEGGTCACKLLKRPIPSDRILLIVRI